MEKKADIVVKNADIQTSSLGGHVSVYSALAAGDGKILAVGTDKEIEEWIGADTKVIDAEGKTVLPGLSDAHLHASCTIELASEYNMYDCMNMKCSREEMIGFIQGKIREYMKNRDISTGIRITGWAPTFFLEDPLGMPTAKDLDEVCPDVPVVLRSLCEHYMWVNTIALEKAGITKDTPDPKHGIIFRDEDGNPTGIFQELPAVNLMKERLKEADYTVEEYRESILMFQERYASPNGITMICDAVATPNAMEAYRQLAAEEKLNLRVSGTYVADSGKPDSQFDEIIAKKGSDNIKDLYHVPTVKFFADGVEFGFYMCEPFEKEANLLAGYPEDYRGFPEWSPEDAKRIFALLDRAGYQIHVHAMGDAAVKMTLDAFAYAREQNPTLDNRHAIAHVMDIKPEDIPRMAKLKVIASMQPVWCVMDSYQDYGRRLTGKRVDDSYPMGKIIKAGGMVAAGTDFPVDGFMDPFIGMQTAMTRRLNKSHPEYETFGQYMLGDEESLMTWEETLTAYTINGAYEMFYEDIAGELAPGKSADFVLLNGTVGKTAVDEFEKLHPEAVYFKGREIYHPAGQEVDS